MTEYTKRAWSCNHQLNLFDWCRERELRHANPAARRIAERFGLPLHRAITIAKLAGIGLEVTR
jgi:hypothetical protein